ncbi:MAG: nucleoside deaminase [Clostridiales bacterium]|nr:nucleoside deaminase [Clostridiales bacterium]
MDIKFMHAALKEAQKAADIGETPIGAVIVHGGKIIARGHNMRETKKNALLHAEIIAIDKACRKLGGWRLPECDIYVTLEPCPMCMGAIIQARIENLYFGAYDAKSGCAGSVCDLSGLLPHKVNFCGGIEQFDCENILKTFFKNLRKREK